MPTLLDGATASQRWGRPVEGVMDWEDDLDYFRFTAEEGQTYRIEVELDTLPEYSDETTEFRR